MRKCVNLFVVGVMLAGCQSTMEQAAVEGGSAPLRPSFDQCIERAEAVTPAMQDCIEAEFVFQNGKMEAALAKLLPAIADFLSSLSHRRSLYRSGLLCSAAQFCR